MTVGSPRRRFATMRVATVLVVAGVLVLAGGYRAPGARAAPTDTRSTAAERVARRFVDAYGGYDAKRALKYLAEEGLATGSGHTRTVWVSRVGFRREVAKTRAMDIKQTVSGCEEQGESGDGVAVRCTFDFHGLRSEEVGLGPYTGNSWDFVVRNGKIASAVSTWDYLLNGFSSERWEPFQAWVASTHPEDYQVMYPVGELQITKDEIRLWDRRLREWVAAVKAGSA